jgi:AcrR family transcriptional regulator
MAYEVTKLVNGRPYRYRVRSERDEQSGKMRNRWTYLGRVAGAGAPVPAKPRPNAREALLDALERLLERSEPSAITAAAVAAESGLAHGTFYRYFRNKIDAVHALADRLRSARAVELALLDDAPAGAPEARAALRAWTDALLRTRTDRPGLVRVWYALAARDVEFQAAGRERRDAYRRRLAGWLHDLAARGIVRLADPEASAGVLFAMLDGIGREAVASGEPLDDAHIVVAVDLIERAVFGALDAGT